MIKDLSYFDAFRMVVTTLGEASVAHGELASKVARVLQRLGLIGLP